LTWIKFSAIYLFISEMPFLEFTGLF